MNRDEQRDRPTALPPRWRRLGRDQSAPTRGIWPTDTRGGGTWIAANDAGLVLCLLNLYLEPSLVPPPDVRSRGLIIPSLIGASDAVSAMAALGRMPLDLFAPFRLVATEVGPRGAPRIRTAIWNGSELSLAPALGAPMCLVSSGLGDSKVQRRLELFRAVVQDRPTPDAQDRFHLHEWPDHPELSVLMSRDQARTVSITTLEILPSDSSGRVASLRMAYEPIREGSQPGTNHGMKAAPMVLLGREG